MESYVKIYREYGNLVVDINNNELVIFNNCSENKEQEIKDLVNNTDKGVLSKILLNTYPEAIYENCYCE